MGRGRACRASNPPHRDLDLDLDVDSTQETQALDVLTKLGYAVETDWRPTRVELIAPDRDWGDLHPVPLDQDANVRQAALGGGFHIFPGLCFDVGHLGGPTIPCVSAAVQLTFHQAYQLRAEDRHDLDLLERLLERP